jgi:RNA polymerase sigma-70 factor, ECF subfamily
VSAALLPRPGDDADARAALVLAAVRDVQDGRRERFAIVYSAHYDQVFALARLMLRDRHEAEDVAQETFMLALRAIRTYRPQAGVALSAWLLRIARNCALKRIQKRARSTALEPAHLDDVVAPTHDEHARGWVDDSALRAELEAMPLTQRQVLLLRFGYDLTAEQTAVVLERSPEAVRQLQSRALRHLRRRLGDRHIERHISEVSRIALVGES